MKFRLVIDKNAEEEILATVHERSELTDRIENEVMRCSGRNEITAYTEDDIKILQFGEIECITVIDGKTYAVSESAERFRLKQRLYEIEQSLPSCFIRINKSSIANQNSIERFSAAYSGAVDAVFKSGFTEYVSRRCFAEIKRRLS